MIEKKIRTVQVEDHRTLCDFCGKEITREYSDKKCVMCGRHVCSQCSGYIDYSGDYSDHTCKECWDIGTSYRSKIIELEEEAENLELEWERLCKENRSKQG